jgi:hypothetical protein
LLIWSLPCQPNANIEKFIIECSTKAQQIPLKFEVNVTDNREDYFIASEDFLPDSIYDVSIWAVANNEYGHEARSNFPIKAGCNDMHFYFI